MKPEYTEKIRTIFENSKNLSIISHISWLNKPQEEIMKTHTNQSLNYLRQKVPIEKTVKVFGVSTLFMFGIKSTQMYMYLLGSLSKLFMDVVKVLFFKCELNNKLLTQVDPEFWQQKNLTLFQSRAQDIILGVCSQKVFTRLKALVIGCDPIGNIGIKKIMKMKMNNLQTLAICNTRCTTDVIKILKKKEKPQYSYHEVLYQQKFDYSRFYKQCLHFRGDKDSKIFNIEIRCLQGKPKSIYFGHLAKIYLKEPKSIHIIVMFDNFQKIAEEELVSIKVLKSMKQFTNWTKIY